MKLLEKLFGKINMTWSKVIIFAIITGVYTGLINQVPFLENTSFRDIAISFEWWVLFAIIIAVNCNKPLESGFKILIFFLISQPLVFLVETPFIGSAVWGYYYKWFIVTLLTFPGGIIAFYAKKQNIIGTVILSVALGILGIHAINFSLGAYLAFPRHILSAIFCFGQIVVLIMVLIKNNKHRLLAAILCIIIAGSNLIYIIYNESSIEISLPEYGEWSYELENNDGSRVTIDDGYSFNYLYKPFFAKENKITFTNDKGQVVIYTVSLDKNKIIQVEKKE